jgi:hypothetical protein
MKWVLVLFYFCLVPLMSSAQVDHFIYIQSDSRQPFYVKLNEQIYSSAAAGYLVIPKLVAGEYQVKIGFPKNEWPVQEWQLTLGNKDVGFLLKPVSDVWALIDLHDFSVQKSLPNDTTTQTQGNAFASTLAQVTGDPGIATKQKSAADTLQETIVLLVEKQDSAVKATEIVVTIPAESIQKLFAEENREGWRAVFLLNKENQIDTVEIFISEPSTSNVNQANLNQAVVNTNPACKQVAGTQIMKQLIAKMQKGKTMEEKITLFRNNAKQQCFSTAQMRILAEQMPTERGKYYLLDAAYPMIADKHACASLGTLFSDPYYKNRFEAMIQL